MKGFVFCFGRITSQVASCSPTRRHIMCDCFSFVRLAAIGNYCLDSLHFKKKKINGLNFLEQF
jgi:hypothetical protein